MDPNKILIGPDSQNPILGDRIKYDGAKQIRAIYESQDKTVFPYPEADDPKHRAMTLTEVRERASKATEAQKVELEPRDENMTKAREPKTTVPQRRRETAPAKAKPKGKLGAAAQAALADAMNGAQNQLRQEDGPKAA